MHASNRRISTLEDNRVSNILHKAGTKAKKAFEYLYKLCFDKGEITQIKALNNCKVDPTLSSSSILYGAESFDNLLSNRTETDKEHIASAQIKQQKVECNCVVLLKEITTIKDRLDVS